MSNTLTIALTRQMAMEQKMDVLANNLANASSAGFKGEQLLFVEFLSEPDATGTISLVQDISVIRDYGQGPLMKTNNPLDVAVNGKGWFAVDTPLGRFYTYRPRGRSACKPRGQSVSPRWCRYMILSGCSPA